MNLNSISIFIPPKGLTEIQRRRCLLLSLYIVYPHFAVNSIEIMLIFYFLNDIFHGLASIINKVIHLCHLAILILIIDNVAEILSVFSEFDSLKF